MVEKFNDGIQFLRGVQREFTKVIWPTRSDLIGSTTVVLILVVFFAVYLGVVDFLLSTLAARVF
jgi:preprotein translocase subunit SecE